jgi:hypothetical protein
MTGNRLRKFARIGVPGLGLAAAISMLSWPVTPRDPRGDDFCGVPALIKARGYYLVHPQTTREHWDRCLADGKYDDC